VASVVLCWLRSRQHPWSSSASGRSNTALPLARPICRFRRSVPPGSLAFADSVTDCGYSRAFTYPPSVPGVSYPGHAAFWFNASACALFRAVLPWGLRPVRRAGKHEERAPNPASSTQESGMSLRRLLRPIYERQVPRPCSALPSGLLFWIPINRQLSGDVTHGVCRVATGSCGCLSLPCNRRSVAG
jgi:hypothetical protein